MITNSEDITFQVKAGDRPADFGMVDLVLFCAKTYGTTDAAKAVLPMLGNESTVLTLSAVIGKTGYLQASP